MTVKWINFTVIAVFATTLAGLSWADDSSHNSCGDVLLIDAEVDDQSGEMTEATWLAPTDLQQAHPVTELQQQRATRYYQISQALKHPGNHSNPTQLTAEQQQLAEQVVRDALPFVRMLALRVFGHTLNQGPHSLEDLATFGMEGVFQGLRYYNPTHGRFSNYIYKIIINTISRRLGEEQLLSYRIPVQNQKAVAKLRAVVWALQADRQNTHWLPSVEEVYNYVRRHQLKLQISDDELAGIYTMSNIRFILNDLPQKVTSVNSDDDDDSTQLIDLIPAKEFDMDLPLMQEQLRTLIDTVPSLPARQIVVARLFLGLPLNNQEVHALTSQASQTVIDQVESYQRSPRAMEKGEIQNMLGISRQAVDRLSTDLIAKIRDHLSKQQASAATPVAAGLDTQRNSIMADADVDPRLKRLSDISSGSISKNALNYIRSNFTKQQLQSAIEQAVGDDPLKATIAQLRLGLIALIGSNSGGSPTASAIAEHLNLIHGPAFTSASTINRIQKTVMKAVIRSLINQLSGDL